MRKKIVAILVVAIVLVGVLAVAVRVSPYRIYPSHIKDVEIFADQYSPTQYYLQLVAGGPNTCWAPWRYCVMRFGNIIFVKVLTRLDLRVVCGQAITWKEKIIALGSCFKPGMKYRVVVNGVAETFVAGQCEIKAVR